MHGWVRLPTTGDHYRAITIQRLPGNVTNLPVRTFHSCKIPPSEPTTTLFRYVGGCARAEGTKPPSNDVSQVASSLRSSDRHLPRSLRRCLSSQALSRPWSHRDTNTSPKHKRKRTCSTDRFQRENLCAVGRERTCLYKTWRRQLPCATLPRVVLRRRYSFCNTINYDSYRARVTPQFPEASQTPPGNDLVPRPHKYVLVAPSLQARYLAAHRRRNQDNSKMVASVDLHEWARDIRILCCSEVLENGGRFIRLLKHTAVWSVEESM